MYDRALQVGHIIVQDDRMPRHIYSGHMEWMLYLPLTHCFIIRTLKT